MLQPWVAINETDLGSSDELGNTRGRKRRLEDAFETRAELEKRLHAAYENALEVFRIGENEKARDAFRAIVADLKVCGDNSAKERTFKKKKVSKRTGRSDDEKDWETRLRYAANRNLGDVCMCLKDYMEAYDSFRIALIDDGDDVMLWVRAGRAASGVGMLHAARQAYEEGLKLVPNHKFCVDGLSGVLAAIGDDDMDLNAKQGVVRWSTRKINEACARKEANNMLNARFKNVQKEKGSAGRSKALTRLELEKYPTIQAAVDQLLAILEKRVESETEMLGAAIELVLPKERENNIGTLKVVPSDSSLEIIVESSNATGAKNKVLDGQERKQSDNGDNDLPRQSKSDPQGGQVAGQSAKEPATSPKSPSDNEAQGERRRSRRQEAKEQKQREEESRTGEQEGAKENDLLNTLLHFMRVGLIDCALPTTSKLFSRIPTEEQRENENVVQLVDFSESFAENPITSRQMKAFADSPWFRQQSMGANDVSLKSTLAASSLINGGPLDLLNKFLNVLTKKETIYYHKLIARIWLALKAHHVLPVPGSFRQTAVVVEALCSLNAAERVSKEVLGEIERLLSLLPQRPKEIPLVDGESFSDMECLIFCARLEWLRTIVARRKDDSIGAFEHCRVCLKHLADARILEDVKIPLVGGPGFAGLLVSVALASAGKEARHLERYAELRAVQKELERETQRSDADLSRVLEMLLPSISQTIVELGLGEKRGNGMKEDGRALQQHDLGHSDKALRVREFLRICKMQSNLIGEGIGQACQLKLSIMDFEKFASQEKDPDCESSAAGNLARAVLGKIVHQVKPICSLVRRLLTQCTGGKDTDDIRARLDKATGYSIVEAAIVIGHSLCYVASVMEKEVPIVTSSTSLVAITSFKKNLRLSLTRAFLGLARCLAIVMNNSVSSTRIDSAKTSEPLFDMQLYRPSDQGKLITMTRYLLTRLAPRGLIREEGTSGILVKLYLNFLRGQLIYVAEQSLARVDEKDHGMDTRSLESVVSAVDFSYSWTDKHVLRSELALGYHCLYKIPDLESLESGKLQECWLSDACALNRKLGLSNTAADGENKAYMDQVTCNSLYIFYRRYFLKASSNHWKDGKRSRKAKDAVRDLLEVLPTSLPSDVPCLTDAELVDAVSAALEPDVNAVSNAASAIASLKKSWSEATEKVVKKTSPRVSDCFSEVKKVQMTRKSRMYYELNALNAMCEYSAYESDFKKHLQTERRKTPSEAIERLIKCQSDLVAALCLRPWSVGAWTALGRVFLEITDVNLDENELVKTYFGSPRPKDKGSSSWLSFLNRAEGCFQLSYALSKEKWDSPPPYSASFLVDAESFDGVLETSAGLNNLICDHLFFSRFGVSNRSDHLAADVLSASALFGLVGVRLLRSRETRYDRTRWARSGFDSRSFEGEIRSMFTPKESLETKDLEDALEHLEKGMALAFKNDSSGKSKNCFSSQKWFYSLQKAKLLRSLGRWPYLGIFDEAVHENTAQAKLGQEKQALEPVYELHLTRCYSLAARKFGVVKVPLDDLVACRFDSRDIIEIDGEAKPESEKVAEDVLQAMSSLGVKNEQPFSEYYFKAIYAKTLIRWKVLEKKREALKEIEKLFRTEQATTIAQTSPDGAHRGYFYLLWNYRFTDTGIEPALESEREFLRWRNKLLRLFVALLRECSESWTLFGAVSRLRRGMAEDRPIDGASMDELLESCADVAIKEFANSVDTASPTLAYAERGLRKSWDIYTGSLRLELAMKRVLSGKELIGDSPAASVKKLKESKRPWCSPKAGLLLLLEYQRWGVSKEGQVFKITREEIQNLEARYEAKFPFEKVIEAVEDCMNRFKTDARTVKFLKKRISLRASKKALEGGVVSKGSPAVVGEEKVVKSLSMKVVGVQMDSIDLLDESLSLGADDQPARGQMIRNKPSLLAPIGAKTDESQAGASESNHAADKTANSDEK